MHQKGKETVSNLFGLLYARPSFLEGVASILDFGGTLTEYNTALTPEQADWLAIRSDWLAVGDDLRFAMGQAARDIEPQRD